MIQNWMQLCINIPYNYIAFEHFKQFQFESCCKKILKNVKIWMFTNVSRTVFNLVHFLKNIPPSLTWQHVCFQYFCVISNFCFKCGVILNNSSHFCHMYCFEEMRPTLHIYHSETPAFGFQSVQAASLCWKFQESPLRSNYNGCICIRKIWPVHCTLVRLGKAF